MRNKAKSRAFLMVKRSIQATLSMFDLELKRVQNADVKSGSNVPDKVSNRSKKQKVEQKKRSAATGWQKTHLRKSGFYPKTIFDVGAANGTPALYRAFPEAFHVLIEPLQENEPHLQKILQEYEGEYFLTAIGASSEQLTINIEPNNRRSSIYSRTNLSPTRPIEKRTIPVTTLDTLTKEHDFDPPFGLKIDTEGFEHQVIKGATNFLRNTQFVIAELSIEKLYEDSYSFAEFIESMDRHGFYLCDVLYMQYDLQSGTKLLHMDAMFRRESSSA